MKNYSFDQLIIRSLQIIEIKSLTLNLEEKKNSRDFLQQIFELISILTCDDDGAQIEYKIFLIML